jgi:hypothetical protein
MLLNVEINWIEPQAKRDDDSSGTEAASDIPASLFSSLLIRKFLVSFFPAWLVVMQ